MNTCQGHFLSLRCLGGFTLIEAMLTLAVLGVLFVMAIPSFGNMIEKRRVMAAAEAIYSDLRWARSESIKRNIGVRVTFVNGSNWSYTVNADPNGGNTLLKTVNGTDFPLTSLSVTFEHDYTTFNPVRGTVRNGSVLLSSSRYVAKVSLSTLGRTRICNIGGYESC
jgi:type IV fimbrial biogenesis protein FimT